VTGRPRPPVDPSLAADLRRFVEHGLDDLVTTGDATPTVVTARRLTGALACPVHRDQGTGDPPLSVPLARGALVQVLFRQWVTVGAIGDAFEDAMGGLATDDRGRSLCAWIVDLPAPEQAELRAEVERQADGLRKRWPRLDPTWLPRTGEPVRVALAPGRVELAVRVDLVLGCRASERASVGLVQVTSGPRRPVHRDDAHLAAVAETLRSGAPPFVAATYYTRTGELDVDPVTPELLAVAARRLVAGVGALHTPRRAADPPTGTGTWCAGCAADPFSVTPPVVPLPSGAVDRIPAPPAVTVGAVAVFPDERAA